MSNNIEGKIVVITGASSGLGEATARLLSAEGASVALGAASRSHPGIGAKQLLILGAAVLASSLCGHAVAQEMQRQMQGQYVQVAEIEIDPAQLEEYRAAVREQIDTAIRVEPGVLVLYAVSEKDNPTRVRVFEIYRDAEGHYRKDGQVAQTCPNNPDYARREGEVRMAPAAD